MLFSKKFNTPVRTLSVTSLMAALVFVSTFFNIQIPIPGLNVMIHLGNVFCILSALLLGPLFGGLASGIGSFFYDLSNPLYISSAPFTLVFKFILGFVCGKIAFSNGKNANSFKTNIIASVCGLSSYIILHLSRTFIKNYFLGVQLNANLLLVAQSALVSFINAVIAIIIAVPLAHSLNKALRKANLI